MKSVRLGRTGLQVSRIGFGGIPIQRPTEPEAIRIVRRCYEWGVTIFDTANGYSTSEERIGKALAGQRDRVIIATKTPARDRATALEHLELSLRRLNVEVIDLWQLHNVSTFEVYEQLLGPGGALEAARQALEAGKIRHIGLSSHSLDVALKAVVSGHFETIQFPLNFVSDEAASELVPLAREHDVGFIAMKPFAGGNLRDANLAIKYLLQFENVVPDPGVEMVEQIEEIVAIVNSGSWALTPQEWQKMVGIRTELGTRFCRQCGYCMPCPQQVNISSVMITQIMWKLWPRELFRDPNWWFSKAVETGRNCVECGECEEKCPYQLPIRTTIVENIAFLESVRS
jgi:predicted aldo/keto reductase-like oxidoreductase